MNSLLKYTATLLGAFCYLFGAGGILVLLFVSKELDLKVLTTASLYPIGVYCFYYISGSNNWRLVVPIGALFPFFLGGLFVLFSIIIDSSLTLGGKDAPFLAAIPTIIIGCIAARYVKSRYFRSNP